MYKVKIVIDGLVKEITVNANSSFEIQNMITNMYGTGKVQIIDIRRVKITKSSLSFICV